jgi:hypothetical protein
MEDTWEIAGETGSKMSAARLPLAALFPLVQDVVFNSQAADTWGYFLPISSDGRNSDYLPDRQQTISLFRNGIREFCGRVVSRKYIFNSTGQGWQIQCQGGWAELEKVPLISDTSATYDIPTANLADSIRAALQKAISDGGARIQIGSIAPMMDCFPLQFRAATVAATVRDLLRFAQDAFTHVDYRSDGHPTLHILRRGSASARTIILGSDSVTRCELSPNDDASPDRVDFIYAVADANGIVTQITESAGVDNPRNRLQVVTAPTGFEEFQTRATENQQTLRTATGLTWAGYLNVNTELNAYVTANSVPSFSVGPGAYADQNSPSTPTSFFTVTFPATTFQSEDDITGKQVVIKGQWRDWMDALGFSAVKATANACFYLTGTGSLPGWVFDLPVPFYYHAGYASGLPAGKWAVWIYVTQAVDMLSPSFPSDTVVRDPGDYPLDAPPAGIASFLLSAMTEPPYDGAADFDSFQPYERGLGKVHNVAGGPVELEAAKATPKQERISIQTGSRSLSFGTSAAGSGLDLMSRFRRVSAK